MLRDARRCCDDSISRDSIKKIDTIKDSITKDSIVKVSTMKINIIKDDTINFNIILSTNRDSALDLLSNFRLDNEFKER